MTRQEAIEYGMRWKNAICDRGDTECSEAIKFLNMAIEALKQEPKPSDVARDIATIIENEQDMRVIALQREPIIHCKDCKYWHEWENGTGACHRSNSIWVETDYDDYCSYAERKEQ